MASVIEYILKTRRHNRRCAAVTAAFIRRARQLETFDLHGLPATRVSLTFAGTPTMAFMASVERKLDATLGLPNLHWDSQRNMLIATK